jgi:hypothetical protein
MHCCLIVADCAMTVLSAALCISFSCLQTSNTCKSNAHKYDFTYYILAKILAAIWNSITPIESSCSN